MTRCRKVSSPYLIKTKHSEGVVNATVDDVGAKIWHIRLSHIRIK